MRSESLLKRPAFDIVFLSCVIFLLTGILGCGSRSASTTDSSLSAAHTSTNSNWTITSQAFKNNQPIPVQFTADGKNISPPLAWSAPPKGSVELALVCHDPDAPVGDWVHWVLYGISSERTKLPENILHGSSAGEYIDKFREGKNSWGRVGYGGPEPPAGPVHHYHFVLYALNKTTSLAAGATRDELDKAMQGHIIAQTELVGTYQRK
jgi:Raf kinase inhibitor-like YbhB/YbcL family protein